ncbi:MAG TPA: diguanylate cyclase [Planctomycetota bacterium]|nr:diguanylate cyclase [Planctomycetota bacterium]
MRELLREADTQGPFHFEHAPSAEAALRRERCIGAGVVLLDPGRPGVAGLEELKLLVERLPGEPVLALSRDGDEALALAALHLGAQDSLRRSELTPDSLARSIRFALERALVGYEFVCQATIDPLTALPNRRGLQQRLAVEASRRRRTGRELLALLLDLDDFKQINDRLGHACGDAVLQEVARRLQRALRGTDAAARIGGDEFLVLLPETSLAESRLVAERIRLALSEPMPGVGPRELHVTASIGIVQVSGRHPGVEDLLVQTHLLLQRSKNRGKNCVSVAGETGGQPLSSDAGLTDIVRRLCSGRPLRAVSQPIHDLRDGRVFGREFLSRSSIPVFEHPADFFRACLESHALNQVDRQCWRTCVHASLDVPQRQRRHLNLFASTLVETDVADLIAELPDESRESYCVEISEQQILGDPGGLARPVRTLREAGVQVALDDVGFGRSCMESLLLLEPEIVKVDRRCTTGIARSPERARALERLLQIAQTLGSTVIAEGIESQEDLDALRERGVPYGQGFLWGQPVEAEHTVDAA